MVVAFGFFMESLDSTVLATALPTIARSLGEEPLALRIVVTSYVLSLAVFIPISGWLSDRFGSRTIFSLALAVFTLGSAWCGAATTLDQLVAARTIQGIGGAMMNPVGRSIVLRAFPKDQLLTATTYMILPGLVGPAVGPLVGGAFATYASWHWIFYVNIPIGLVGFVLALRLVPQMRAETRPRFDMRGWLLLAAGLAALHAGVEWLPNAERRIACLVAFFAAVTLLFAYVLHARRRSDPPVDLGLLRIRCFRAAMGPGSFSKIGLAALPMLLPLYFQFGFGLSAIGSGALTFATAIGAVAMKPIQPRLLRRTGLRGTLILNSIVLAGMAASFIAIGPATPALSIWALLLAFGVSRSLQFASINALGYADLPAPALSKAATFVAVMQQLTQCFGIALGTTLLALSMGARDVPEASDFPLVFVAVAAFPLLSIVGFLRLRGEDGAVVSGRRALQSG